MKVECPFCGVPIQINKTTVPNDFKCPGCNKPFTSETIATIKKKNMKTCLSKLGDLYFGSKRPCSTRLSEYQAVLLMAIAADRSGFRFHWETAGYPTNLDEIENVLVSQIDYDPNRVAIFSSSNRDRREAAAYLLYLLAENHTNDLEGQVGHGIQEDIISLIVKVIDVECDMRIVELLCHVLTYWSGHRAVRKNALRIFLSVLENNGEAIWTGKGSSFLDFLGAIMPDTETRVLLLDFGSGAKHDRVNALKQLITDKLKSISEPS